MSIPFSARFVLNRLGTALGCTSTFLTRHSGALKRSNGVYELERWDVVIRFSRKVDFTTNEKKFIRIVIDSYDRLDKQWKTRGVAHQYMQTAITSSVFDIGVSRFVSDSRRNFLNIHRLIQYFKLLSYEKYEGEQVKIGCLVTPSRDIEQKEYKIGNTKYELVPASSSVSINQELIGDSAFWRYVNGVDSFYMCDTSLNVYGFLNVLSSEYDNFRNITSSCIEDYVDDDGEILFYIGVTGSADLELFVDDSFRLLFRKGRWYFIDCDLINSVVSPGYSTIEPWKVLYSMSKIKKGTVILIVDDNNADLKDLVVRHTSSETGMRSAMRGCVVGNDLKRLCETGEMMRILSTDGMTILDNRFSKIMDFNAIVNTGLSNSESGGGGRTSAAIAGSVYGTTIKVSEDGPITIYKDQDQIYKVG